MSSSASPALRIDWATHAAARFACERWHYSRCMPAGKCVHIGVWEGGAFIGVVLFSRGANNHMLTPYGLTQTEGCELTRIALNGHVAPVTRIIRIAILFLKRSNPGLRMIVSYADPQQGHHGGIYQGGNWIYIGHSKAQTQLVVNGQAMHKRTAASRWGTAAPSTIQALSGAHVVRSAVFWKHAYLLALDEGLHEQLVRLAQPYPKRVKEQDAEHPSALGGVTPTRALHSEAVA